MATRRPKVPRATPAALKHDASAGGDVIQADFGGPQKQSPEGSAVKSQSHEAPKTASRRSTDGRRKNTHGTDGRSTGGRSSGTPRRDNSRTGSQSATNPGEAADTETLDPVPARAFSGRMLALAVVMIAITVMLAPTVKIFIDKRAEIAALEADIAARQAEQDGLKQQVSRWQDPNYVKQQARDRINMVMPGETGYWVFGGDQPAGTSSGQPGAASAENPANLPWVDALWESIRRSATD
jgi:cell division protein FtsB